MAFPDIDPIIFQIGPFALRWYALAYLAGFILGLVYMRGLSSKFKMGVSRDDLTNFLTWAILGVILGGRLGYVTFYQPAFYLENPLQALQVWKGGMSFHGGFLGVVIAMIVFSQRRNIELLRLADLIAVAAPIGLFFGRIANFINGELFGRVSDVPWAVVFPRGGDLPRHPSQLYEAALEGLLLFILLNILVRLEAVRNRPGVLTGVFLIGYAMARIISELFREPDAHIGFLLSVTTMGQWLSAPVLVLGLSVIIFVLPRREKSQGIKSDASGAS